MSAANMCIEGNADTMVVKFVLASCLTGDAKEEHFYQYTVIDEYSRFRYLEAFTEHSTYSSKVFLEHMLKAFKFKVECVQTDNGVEFTRRLSHEKPTLFEQALAEHGIRHKLIRVFTLRHNGKVERNYREDQKRFYDKHSFYSLTDFGGQLAVRQNRSNNLPMRPLHWSSPAEILHTFTVQNV